MSRFLFVVFLLLVIAFGLTFAVENAQTVPFNYFVGQAEPPLSLLLVITVFFGVILGLVAGLFFIFKLKREIRRLRKSESVAQEELRNLRTIPIKDSP